MTELVIRSYWWPEVTKYVGKYKILEKLQTYLMVDFIMKLPLVAEKDIILVVHDKLSKIAYFVAITEETLVESKIIQR